MKNEQDQKPEAMLRKFGLFAVIIGDLVGFTGAGVALGFWAWSKWGAPWWVMLLSSLFGMSCAFYKIYRMSQKEL